MKFLNHIPFVEHLGMQLVSMAPGESELLLELRDELKNSFGVAHGGVVMTLLDVAMAHAARSPMAEGGDQQSGVVTIEMKTAFMRPGQGRLTAKGRRLHRTTTMAFCEGSIFDEKGQLLSHATGTFKYMAGLPAGPDGRRINKLTPSE